MSRTKKDEQYPYRKNSMPIVGPLHEDALFNLIDNNASATEYALYLYIQHNVDLRSGRMHRRPINRIANDLKRSRRSVFRAFAGLEEKGAFESSEATMGGRSPYTKLAYDELAKLKGDQHGKPPKKRNPFHSRQPSEANQQNRKPTAAPSEAESEKASQNDNNGTAAQSETAKIEASRQRSIEKGKAISEENSSRRGSRRISEHVREIFKKMGIDDNHGEQPSNGNRLKTAEAILEQTSCDMDAEDAQDAKAAAEN